MKMEHGPRKTPGLKHSEIWVVGDELMDAAKQQAERGPVGLNLGLAKKVCAVRWLSLGKFSAGFFHTMTIIGLEGSAPDIILAIFDVGDNLDKGHFKPYMKILKNDLDKTAELFPHTDFWFSPALNIPGRGQLPDEILRINFNYTLAEWAKQPRFHLLKHTEPVKALRSRQDKRLSDEELDLFLASLRDCLQEAIYKRNNAVPERSKKPPSVRLPPGRRPPVRPPPVQPPPVQPPPVRPTSVRPPSVRPPSATPGAARHKEIWLVGDELMAAANRRAKNGTLGLNLGFERETCIVHWIFLPKFCSDMYRMLRENSRSLRSPDIILAIFHIGDRLLQGDSRILMKTVRCDLGKISAFLPYTDFMLSPVLPIPGWQKTPEEILETRFNHTLGELAKRPRFHVLTHERLVKALTPRQNRCLTDAELDLFLESLRDNLQEAMSKGFKTVTQTCVPSFSAIPVGKIFKKIWMIGSGFMDAAKSRALNGSLGHNLGFDAETCKVFWMEMKSALKMFPNLRAQSQRVGTPDIILFYIGCSDLGNVNYEPLIKSISSSLQNSFMSFKGTEFILSTLLPKPEWCGTSTEEWRQRLTSDLTYHQNRPRFHLLKHDDLEKSLFERYVAGDHSDLTEAETDLFLTNIRDSLQKIMFKGYKPRVTNSEMLFSADITSEELQGSYEPFDGEEAEPVFTGTKDIWIMGGSYIMRANLHADAAFGGNLGFDSSKWTVRWMVTNNRWFTLVTDMHYRSQKRGVPCIVYLHIGSNDLEVIAYEDLFDNFTFDISRLSELYPKTQFIFSTILPKAEWMYSVLEESRIQFNTAVGGYAEQHGFIVVRNSELEEILLQEFHQGRKGSALTDPEKDIFLRSMRLSAQNAMLELGEPVTEEFYPFQPTLKTGAAETGPNHRGGPSKSKKKHWKGNRKGKKNQKRNFNKRF